jgi:hypothetical protein
LVRWARCKAFTLETPITDLHPFLAEGAGTRGAIEFLRANRIDPKFLYATPRQSELWRKVFLRRSPIHTNPEFGRIYREAFAGAVERLPPGKIALVGLGCGTGLKELELYSHVKASGREALFIAVDASRDLVEESVEKLVVAGAGHQRSLVCDLAETDYLKDWLEQVAPDLPRVITFFGLVPNLAPSLVVRIFRAALRHGDMLLASAHLAPIGDGVDLPTAMQLVLPQYDNPETLAWLTAALEAWRLEDLVETPKMEIGAVEGFPAFVALARWKSDAQFVKWGHAFSPKRNEPLRLFHSLRYTPALFENVLEEAGFDFQRLALTRCKEEAIWAIR